MPASSATQKHIQHKQMQLAWKNKVKFSRSLREGNFKNNMAKLVEDAQTSSGKQCAPADLDLPVSRLVRLRKARYLPT